MYIVAIATMQLYHAIVAIAIYFLVILDITKKQCQLFVFPCHYKCKASKASKASYVNYTLCKLEVVSITQDEYNNYKLRRKAYLSQYAKDKYHPVQLKFDKDFYESVLLPVAAAQGLQVGAWIKQAVIEKLEREKT